MSNNKAPLAESDERIKKLDEKARAVLIDVIEKGCLNFMDVANILSQITEGTETIFARNTGCHPTYNGGCNSNCVKGCACKIH